jgi:hypothetical protein
VGRLEVNVRLSVVLDAQTQPLRNCRSPKNRLIKCIIFDLPEASRLDSLAPGQQSQQRCCGVDARLNTWNRSMPCDFRLPSGHFWMRTHKICSFCGCAGLLCGMASLTISATVVLIRGCLKIKNAFKNMHTHLHCRSWIHTLSA